jgi:glycosyltransferase involved in cell wall biosynthesis
MPHKSENPIPVLYFTNSTLWGGVERHICGLLQTLSRKTFRVHLVCDPAIAERFHEAVPPDVQVESLELSRPAHIASAVKLAHLILGGRFQIVHSHMFWSSLFASPIAWACRVPVILETLHGTEAWRKGWKANNTIDRVANCFVTKHVAVCKSDARFLQEKKGVPGPKIEIIHNGIDARRIRVSADARNTIRHAIGANETDCILITVARFHKGKGHHVLLAAMQRLLIGHPQTKLVLLGEGAEQAEMRSLCRTFGIAEKIYFAGYQANVAEWLSAADINVLPTFYEGLPLTILEAMAAGLPTVASDVGGIPDAIGPGVSGLLVPAGDPRRLAEAISSLLRDPAERKHMGSEARNAVLQGFTLERQVQTTEKMYLELLNGSRATDTSLRTTFAPPKNWQPSADGN